MRLTLASLFLIACTSTNNSNPVCGDGIVDPGEQCDDGAANGTAGDGCTASCTFVSSGPVCGNGIVENGEQCDHGANNGQAGDTCTATCQNVVVPTGHIVANWAFHDISGTGVETATGCPTGFDTAAVHTVAAAADGTALDPCTSVNSNCYIDLFNCTDFTGTTSPLPAQNYLTWIEITNTNGTSTYATSVSAFVDITTTDKTFSADILNNGGYFMIKWSLVGESSGSTLLCSQTAAATSAGGSIEITSTINGTATALSDKFNCEDHFGYSAGLPADVYTVAVDALNSSNQALSTNSTTLTNRTIGVQNQVTDLGHVNIPIAGM